MRVAQRIWTAGKGWQILRDIPDIEPQLVLYFFGRQVPHHFDCDIYAVLRGLYPDTQILGCSTGGEIIGGEVVDDSLVVTAIEFAHTPLHTAAIDIGEVGTSFACGRHLATALNAPDLKYVFLLSDGLNVNGSELVAGLYSALSHDVLVTGGLAGDGADFVHTQVGLNAPAQPQRIAAVGFYGDAISIGHGCGGGWETFGPSRRVTRAEGNVLYELDGKPALALYKHYLGEEAEDLPGSALLFPLAIHSQDDAEHATVRTVLAVDETEQSMTFAGDIAQGQMAKLMHASFSDLVDAAESAAQQATINNFDGDALTILVSCIGRKLLLAQNISDETEVVRDALGPATVITGFYSYGEISHDQFNGDCALFNQTMTVTVLHERI